jgi:hypothetical protein
VLPKAAAEPEPARMSDDREADLADQLQSYLAAFQLGDAAAAATKSAIAPGAAAEPELVVHPDPIVVPTLESVAGAETDLIVMDEPEAELIVVDEPEPIDFVAESIVAASEAPPSVNGASGTGVPQPTGERSARSLPELSLRPSAPITVPRPAPIASPAAAPLAKPAAAPAVGEPHKARVSFKDLAGALLGGADPAAPATPVEAADSELEAEAPADLVIEPEGEAATPVATTVPQQFEGLKFPSDGVLTRQWMEFLSQVSTK